MKKSTVISKLEETAQRVAREAQNSSDTKTLVRCTAIQVALNEAIAEVKKINSLD